MVNKQEEEYWKKREKAVLVFCIGTPLAMIAGIFLGYLIRYALRLC